MQRRAALTYALATSLLAACTTTRPIEQMVSGTPNGPPRLGIAVVTLQTLRQRYAGLTTFGSWQEDVDLSSLGFDDQVEQTILRTLWSNGYAAVPLNSDRNRLRKIIYRDGVTPTASIFGQMVSAADKELNAIIGAIDVDLIVLVVQSQKATIEMLSQARPFVSNVSGDAILALDLVALNPKTKRYINFSELREMKRNGGPAVSLSGNMAKSKWKDWPADQKSWFLDYFMGEGVKSVTNVATQRLWQ